MRPSKLLMKIYDLSLNGKDIDELTGKAIKKFHLQQPEIRPFLRKHHFPLQNNTFLGIFLSSNYAFNLTRLKFLSCIPLAIIFECPP